MVLWLCVMTLTMILHCYPTDYTSDDSKNSSVFNFVCKICLVRALKQTHLEFQFIDEQMYLIETDKDI